MKIFAYLVAISVALLASLTKVQTLDYIFNKDRETIMREWDWKSPQWIQKNPKLLHEEPLGSMVRKGLACLLPLRFHLGLLKVQNDAKFCFLHIKH